MKVQRIRDCGLLSPKWDICVIHPLPRLRDLCRRGGGKSVIANVFWTQQGSCIYEPRVVETSCTRPLQAPSTGWGGGHRILPLWQLAAAGRGGSQLKGVVPGRLTMLK